MTADNPILDLLASPLSENSTVEGLAEQLLATIAQCASPQGFTLDAAEVTDRQARRLLRPLLACLAMKHAAEAGNPPNIYEGELSFKRSGPDGPVLILGQIENKQGAVRVVFRRSSPEAASPTITRSGDLRATSPT